MYLINTKEEGSGKILPGYWSRTVSSPTYLPTVDYVGISFRRRPPELSKCEKTPAWSNVIIRPAA